MRMLTASIALTVVVLLPGCTTFQEYPAFGTGSGRGQGSGTVSHSRFVYWDRRNAPNLLPPSRPPVKAEPGPVEYEQDVR